MKLYQYYSAAAEEIVPEDIAYREYLDKKHQQRKIDRKFTTATAPKKQKTKNSPKRRRAKTTPEIRWLKSFICPFVYAEKTPDGIRPSVRKETLIGRWNMGLGLPSLPNYKLLDHFQGRETLYFMANGWEKNERTLVMIDIDVLKSKGLGSPEGAKKFAAHLKTIWPDLYFETSTSGKGIHGYFILRKKGADASRTNAALKRLEKWLRAESVRVGADIEQVEVKGTCLDLTLDGKMAQSVKYGVPAKLPRDVARFDEWQETTVLRVHDLENRHFDVIESEAVVSVPEKVNDGTEKVIASFSKGDDHHTVLKMPSPKVKNQIVAGSVSGKVINEEELASIPAYERMYREWVGPNDLMAGKFRVTAHDFAVAMVLLQHFKREPESNGALPVRRAGKMWMALKLAGDTDRGWNHHRWKRIRDFLSERGHLDWKDNRYELPIIVKDENGEDDPEKTIKGIACKWSITDEYDQWLHQVALMTNLKQGGASSVDTNSRRLVPPKGKGKNLRPTSCFLREILFWQRSHEASDLLYAA